MKKIKLGLLVGLSCVLLGQQNLKAQDYYHGFGGGVNYGIFTLKYTSSSNTYSGTSALAIPGVMYKSSFSFGDAFAVSAYPFLGLYFSGSSRGGGSGGFGCSLPINAEFHAGDLDDACFFAGGGFNYTFLAASGAGSGSIIGPEIALGGQFDFRDRLVGLRVALTFGLNKSGIDDPDITVQKDSRMLISLGAYYVLGQ